MSRWLERARASLVPKCTPVPKSPKSPKLNGGAPPAPKFGDFGDYGDFGKRCVNGNGTLAADVPRDPVSSGFEDGGAFAGRVATIGEGSGVPEEWAEGLARLDPACPPLDVPAKRWSRFVDDCGRFLDDWAARAADLGWRVEDAFGCHPRAPFARLDHAGLAWMLNGRPIVELTAETATIATPNGGRLTYRRKSRIDPETIAPWELVQ